MLRHAAVAARRMMRDCPSRRRRRSFTAAATALQKTKRALNQQQIQGTTAAGTAAAGTGNGGGANVPPPSPPSANNSNALPLTAAGIMAAGTSAYFYYTATNAEQPQPKSNESAAVDESSTTTAVVADYAPTFAAAAAATISPNSSSSSGDNAAVETDSGGNRVWAIQVPSKMQNTTSSKEEEEEDESSGNTNYTPLLHPPSGNRVSSVLPNNNTTETLPRDDTSLTHAAILALQQDQTTTAATEAVIQAHQSMWSSSTSSVGVDNTDNTDSVSSNSSKTIAQLELELRERTKWEAVRLKEFLAMKEAETADQYLSLLQKQRLEFEDLMAKRLREQDNALSTRMYHALQEKEATIQSVLNTAMKAQQTEHEADKAAFEEIATQEIKSALHAEYGKQLEDYKNQMSHDLQQKVASLEALSQKLQQLQSALDVSNTSKEGSHKAHRLSAAALALSEKLETNVGAALELAALKLAAGNVGVISTACATIPAAVQTGVPTLSELQTRFVPVFQKCRQAALVPVGRPGLEGQLAGILFATLKYPPDVDTGSSSPVGSGNTAAMEGAEYLLARAQKHVQLGELEHAVEQLDKLEGQAAFTIADWRKDAIDRIAVEKALKVIKLECALLNESCLEDD